VGLVERKTQVEDQLIGLEMELAIQISRVEAIESMIAFMKNTIGEKRGELAEINSQLN
jgi:hypothetical protein